MGFYPADAEAEYACGNRGGRSVPADDEEHERYDAFDVCVVLLQLRFRNRFILDCFFRIYALTAKKGLPPIDEKTVENRLKLMQAKEDSEEKNRMEKIAKQNLKTKESTDYYNQNAKEGSLASKANMVQLYNEKHEKKEKK